MPSVAVACQRGFGFVRATCLWRIQTSYLISGKKAWVYGANKEGKPVMGTQTNDDVSGIADLACDRPPVTECPLAVECTAISNDAFGSGVPVGAISQRTFWHLQPTS